MLAFLDQRTIEPFLGVELEGAQARQRLVEVAALALELLDALGDALEPAPVLRGRRLCRPCTGSGTRGWHRSKNPKRRRRWISTSRARS
jgi:hypothetical protein